MTEDEFESLKDQALRSSDRAAIAERLLDPRVNLEYVAKYLALTRKVTGLDSWETEGAQRIPENYNRGAEHWFEDPSAYGRAYRERKSIPAHLRLFRVNLLSREQEW